MFSRFFIERPILSNVIAIVMMLLGAVALLRLPVAQYPEITPPTVVVSCVYPGANAETVADTVGAPLEQQINGVEKMLYMSSKCASDGSYSLTVTFDVGTDLDMATVLVQNRANVAMSSLPQEVQRQGLTIKKKSSAILLAISLTSTNPQFDDLYLSNFATLRIIDELSRIPGVGEADVFGVDSYSMRIWLAPDKLKALGLTPQDVINAVSEQNAQVAAGQIGQPPTPPEQNFQLTVSTTGRLKDVAQFEDIIVKTAQDQAGRVVRVKDLAKVELGGRTYDRFAQKDGKPGALIPVYLLPGANALDVADKVKARVAELAKSFPEGIVMEIPFNTTKFVEAGIEDVYKTLFEAGILVLVVILLFLQDWKAMLVPATTVPVTILGSFVAMSMLGFSVNLVTLFGIVLAIGIVVDDAIIVVEGAAHHMEHGLAPKAAAMKTMDELMGSIMGITLVLTAVFVPVAFMGGITGQLYRQFALVIAATAVISAINALTLKPTQCALWLRPIVPGRNAFYRAFNAVYDQAEKVYVRIVDFMVHRAKTMMLAFAGLLALTGYWFASLPTGFLPTEDQGYCIIAVQLPGAASQARTREVLDKMNGVLSTTPGVETWISFGGMSILDNGSTLPNCASVFAAYTDWSKRGKDLSQEKIVESLQARFSGIEEAIIMVMTPPPIQGLGQAAGFEMVVQDQGSLGARALQEGLYGTILAGRSQSGLAGLGATYSANTPQLFLDVDRTQAKTYDLPLSTVFGGLQAYLGSYYINDFNKFGRTYQVRAQAEAKYRLKPDDIKTIEVRSNTGKMVPLGSLVKIKEVVGPAIVTRYNLYTAASLYGAAAPGFSSGQAMGLMEQTAKANLPNSMNFEWTGTAYQEKLVGGQAYLIFALAVLLIYLVLSAQYESWSSPVAVILVVPLALLGTAVAVWLRGMDNNIYTQIGVVLLIALASKNAILIVEFARQLLSQGKPLLEAVVEASRLRFRPILMTSFAFILGVVPLLTASGAGGASQRAVGTAVFGGMLASTFLAVLFVPVFVVVIHRLVERFGGKKAPAHEEAKAEG
jgi:HAE1 family hydrophobic/amphiphilic exporter-1